MNCVRIDRPWWLACALGASTLGCRAPEVPSSIPPPATAPLPFVSDAVEDEDDEVSPPELAAYIAANYDKTEVRIPMRDGTELFTAIFSPKAADGPVPIMMYRTPYAVDPYGPDGMPDKIGPSEALTHEDWIFVHQDVRGRFMSDGEFVNMTPHVANKRGNKDIDESTDTYDTIEWLLANVQGHNGRVGQWGISYPGFYAAAGMIDAHPALVAVSPQAPIADWFFDDFHHRGAFFLPHTFNFMARFGVKREGRTTEWTPRFDHGTPDGYRFFLDLGPLTNVNARHYKGKIAFWNEAVAHPNYDAFWKARDLLPHLNRVAPAVMIVGGWFDAEDLYGPLNIYRSVEAKNPKVDNRLVMGPWRHGGWGRSDGDHLAAIPFGSKTGAYYRNEIEATFFRHHLADGPAPAQFEARVFETGTNEWRSFDVWPPKTELRELYAAADGALSSEPPKVRRGFEQWQSDPKKPVPYTELVSNGMNALYMIEDQRFASRRTDVVTFRSEPLAEATTVAGPILADLWVSTSGSGSDWVVKVIDQFPAGDATFDLPDGKQVPSGDYEMMVRSEVIRGRFRDGFDTPVPFTPNKPTRVALPLQDVLHTFPKGHRIVVQIHSTWFPLVDINPHHYADNVFQAKAADFVPATQRVYRDVAHPTKLQLHIVP
ncbi:MAG: CocE/NonD family hydrolase [Myxococcota bacterium]